jgi:hypothetical protein
VSQIPTGVVITAIGVIVLLSANLFDDNTTAQAILSVGGAVIAVVGAVMAWRYRHNNKSSTG